MSTDIKKKRRNTCMLIADTNSKIANYKIGASTRKRECKSKEHGFHGKKRMCTEKIIEN
jgi:hypothetical protein